ncbi:NAD(P)-dependent alcohol dehydrogenase [Salsipaludibacter albus]|uniref:NAD(P)-dependent alcohol dehydrogenase n=1 Tax=Salsipaludibacter albus TaxID=2849650 RepID=UPI001EE4D94D|nr:NAD(P)-dependent alcohol dehydrogenase [Salsipaludibacter albus]MBY5162594.1 NAD(P)-dependent alcohol dehydrogenase [Salsipaludibacter albus]
MRAIVQDGYGAARDVLSLQEVPAPRVGPGEVLVAVRATSVHPDVWHVVTGRPHVLRLFGNGLVRPRRRVPGTDMAGEVVGVGADVDRFRVGDRVFGEVLRGNQWNNGGAWAEYVAVRADNLAPLPPGVGFIPAATVPTAGLIVLMNLPDRPALGPGRRVLVNGAAGGVGGLALQVARARGAEVTGVDLGPDRLAVVRRLGADHVVDAERDDFTTGEERYDLVFDVPGNHPYDHVRRVLTDDGVYVLVGHDGYGTAGRWLGSMPRVLRLVLRSRRDRHLPPADLSASPDRGARTADLAALLVDGAITPVVDRELPLDRAAEALDLLASGTARGRIVLVP